MATLLIYLDLIVSFQSIKQLVVLLWRLESLSMTWTSDLVK